MGAAQPALNQKRGATGSTSVTGLLVRLVLLALIDGFAIWFIFQQIANNTPVLAIAIGLITLFANVVVMRDQLFPIRWMLLGLALMAMFSVYPILFTANISLTNFGFGHLQTKEQAIEQFEKVKYLPEGAGSYSFTAYVSDDGQYALWLQGEDGEALLALPGKPIVAVQPGEEGVGELDGDGIPTNIELYERLNSITIFRHLPALQEATFGEGDRVVRIPNVDSAAELEQKYIYDSEADTLTDQETGIIYRPVDGTFTSDNGEKLPGGYQVYIGLENFKNFFASPAISGPLVLIIIWNFAFAFFSVGLTFALGLAVALIFSDHELRGRKLILTLLLIPYTIPSLISILVWRGLLDPELGIVNKMLESIFHWSPAWFTDPWWAKAAVLLVNLWLGYPYFMLVCSGALQAIPHDIYGAAEVDGAGMWQRFWRITLPLLLVAIGPLLVASFIFNFNNFNVIYLLNSGRPVMANAATDAGHTDILISYVYKLAFAGGRGAQYGFAAAITLVIFAVVAVMTLLQFRYTKMWEEVGENV
jgi:ABC-type sugar transport system permease subunit